MTTVDPSRLVFIDESGSTVTMTRIRGRSPRGQRCVDRVPRNRGNVVTIIGALRSTGMEAMMTIEGGTSGEVFLAYVEKVLAPTLRPGDVVVWDNLGAHKTEAVREAVRKTGAELKFLPPYSPDLNPIEMAWPPFEQLPRAPRPS